MEDGALGMAGAPIRSTASLLDPDSGLEGHDGERYRSLSVVVLMGGDLLFNSC